MQSNHLHESLPLPCPAEPEWLADDTPFSSVFQDVYYSREDGCAESEYVFLRHNALAERWSALQDCAQTLFVIGETGFGTGLNFVLAWQLWRGTAPPSARLLFRSLEAHPLSAADMQRALARWPELAGEAGELAAQWPPALPGLHTLHFDAGRVTLQVYIGDVSDALDQFRDAAHQSQQAVDAWFLDGFAPSRNSAMWSAQVMDQIAALSRPGATLATFTVAAHVRKALTEAGFVICKQAGYGRKRDMLSARLETARPGAPVLDPETPWHWATHPATGKRQALVIGAGIAGCSTARALARRGWQVTVLDAQTEPAGGASGNPQGALFTQLPRADSPHGEFTLHSYLYALRFHAALLGDDPQAWQRCGLLQLYSSTEQQALAGLRERFAVFHDLVRFVDSEEASELAGLKLALPGLFLPGSGWIDPRAACARLLDHASIRFVGNARVHALDRDSECWRACTDSGEHGSANALIVASGHDAARLLADMQLPLGAVRGQLSLLPASEFDASPRCVVSGEGYVVPARGETLCCGASYGRGETDTDVRDADHRHNLERLRALLADDELTEPPLSTLDGRAAVRCVTPDRLPAAGPLAMPGAIETRYAALRYDARKHIAATVEYQAGLYLNTGHGSRGLTSAPICSELIAAHICGEASPLPRRLQRALSPARFALRRLIKGL